MARYSFTINNMRSTEEINSYKELLDNGLFQGIEIFYPYRFDKDRYDLYTNNIHDLIKGRNVEVVLHLPHGGVDNDLCDGNESAIQRFYDAIDYGRQFNVTKYTLHLGSTKYENYLDNAVKVMKKLCSYTDAYIMIENMPGSNEVAFNLEEMKYILDNTNMKNCKVIYDTGHGHVSFKDTKKEIEFLKYFKNDLMHMHICDNDSTRDAHAPIGTGNIEFDKLFESIKGYNELYCLEIIFKDKNDLINYQTSLKKILNQIE